MPRSDSFDWTKKNVSVSLATGIMLTKIIKVDNREIRRSKGGELFTIYLV